MINFYHKVARFWQLYIELTKVKEENLRLKRKIKQLTLKNNRYQESLKTINRLKRLLGLKNEIRSLCLGAMVIGSSPNSWFKSILIDKGIKDGLKIHTPIIAPEGLVGQVINVSSHYAKVLLITDYNSKVSVICSRSRARGIFVGQGSRNGKVEYVLKDEDIKPGDILITSGLEGIFPKGIVVGKVLDVRDQKEGLFKEIWAKTAVNFGHLEEVLVLVGEKTCSPLK